jgi:MFS family permease
LSDSEADQQTHVRRGFIWKVSLIAGLGGILYGFDMGVIASALIFVRETFSLGVAIGFTSVTAPVYVSELAPPKSRGMLIGLYQFALTLGIAFSDLVGYWLAGRHAWRLMFGIGAIPAALFVVLILTLPESPRWLYAQNQIAKAKAVRLPAARPHSCRS